MGGDATLPRSLTEGCVQEVLADYLEGEEISMSWSAEPIIWSFIIACIGAYVAQTSAVVYMKHVRGTHWYWLLLAQAGLALGVSSVWSMHFVGMFAMELQNPGKPAIPMGYEPFMTVVSGLAAWVICCIALHLILNKDHFGDLRVGEVTARVRFWRWLRSLPRKRLAVSAVLVSVGVVIMHYMGMLSQTGHFTMEFRAANIIASGLVAIAAACAALPIFMVTIDSILFRLMSSIGIGIFVNSMHYTGITSASYSFASVSTGIIGESTLAWTMHYKDVIIFALMLNLFLMGLTDYYVQLSRQFVKNEETEMQKKLTFEEHKKSVKGLIKKARIFNYPMSLVRYETFARLGKLVAHEQLRDSHRLLFMNTVRDVLRLKKKNHIVFFSHQWLSTGVPDPTNDHYTDMITALQGFAQMFRVRTETVHVWVDYSSIPQVIAAQQQLAIDSLVSYVSVSSAFVIVAPQTVHVQSQSLCNFDTYSKRFWCRLEVFSTILSSMRQSELKKLAATQITEEGEDEDEDATVQPGFNPEPQLRIFTVVKGGLHPLTFFTKEGNLQPRYEPLIRLFEGQTTCCEKGHEPGDEIHCDKARVVDSLTGAYGAMLQDVRKAQRAAQGQSGQQFKLVEEIVRQRRTIFPEEYFESRIDAVHARLDRGLFGHGDDTEALGRDTDVLGEGGQGDSESSDATSEVSSRSELNSRRGSKPSQIGGSNVDQLSSGAEDIVFELPDAQEDTVAGLPNGLSARSMAPTASLLTASGGHSRAV